MQPDPSRGRDLKGRDFQDRIADKMDRSTYPEAKWVARYQCAEGPWP